MIERIQPPRRIILANRPRLLRSLLKQVIEEDPALQIVGEVFDLARLPGMVGQTGAQLVILALQINGQLPEVTARLLVASPSLCILALATDGSRIKVRWLEPQEREIHNPSLAELRSMLHRSFSG